MARCLLTTDKSPSKCWRQDGFDSTLNLSSLMKGDPGAAYVISKDGFQQDAKAASLPLSPFTQ